MAAQVTMGLALGVLAVRATQLLHESVPSAIRAGVASGVGTVTWALFIPFALASGWLAQVHGVDGAGALFVGAGLLLALGVLTHAGTHDRR
ncbi:hypothetical protein V6K52_00765 [Knoellia sp. S7-12]|uniref:hypothetical protein n=1 Tax=Knoellia sp. S7-12 TaxID=3126698 RepID=UPI00336942FB